jgi:hypothetical protein
LQALFGQQDSFARKSFRLSVGFTPKGGSMSFATALPYHLRPRREKVFGDGRPRALDRNAKARIMVLGRALMRRTEKGKAYGAELDCVLFRDASGPRIQPYMKPYSADERRERLEPGRHDSNRH